ncbi:MAG: methylmalonyl Co-A mutase-associated GTPase MeaB [Aliishimia sp.]
MDLDDLKPRLIAGERRALARAITLVESTRATHRRDALELLETLPKERKALRIALSGTPGVGKSTFIESFGMMLVEQGLKVAVLAIDPSSARTGGSILGDKTRMDRLAREANAFIRPSPSQTHLGGVGRRTREAVSLCEAAGFDVVLIETVGVGQSETVAAQLSDLFVLLMAPAGGDELQGVKRGIMEMADMILVNKADGDLKPAAMRTCADYAGAMRLLRKRPQDPDGYPQARMVSSLHENGLDDAWRAMTQLSDWRRENGYFEGNRATQARYWLAEDVRQGLLATMEAPESRALLDTLGQQVATGAITPSAAAAYVLTALNAAKPLDA